MIRHVVARGSSLLLTLLLVAAAAPAAHELSAQTPAAAAIAPGREMVVLLHGLGRTRLSMVPWSGRWSGRGTGS